MKPTMMYAYSNQSNSGKLVAEALGVRRINHENSQYTGGGNHVVINWGASELPAFIHRRAGRVINSSESVSRGLNKLDFFDYVDGKVVTPEWTDSARMAKSWLRRGETVIARTRLESSKGQGIVVMKSLDDFTEARLYTKYIEKDSEYRVHVVNGKVVYTQRKVKDPSREITNEYIRNYDSGWILLHADATRVCPMVVKTVALLAVEALGQDYSGVDVIVKDGMAYVLEVNAAPHMTEGIASAYAKEFETMIGD